MAYPVTTSYIHPMLLARIDRWIGATLFVPPIVKLCQRTGQTQYAVSRLFWFFAALDGLWRSDTLVSAVMFGVMSVFMMLTASLWADWPTRSSMVFRLLAVAFLAMDVVQGLAKDEWAGVEFWIIVLAAEYAASIRTIPTVETRKRRVAKADAR
jgi:hypothetical protein